jgi:hypothetical protein
MSVTLSQPEIDALESDTQKIGVFFRMATDPVVRLWLGVGDVAPGINALDAENETYSGLGQLIDVPALQELINGVADRVTFHVSGVSAETSAMASTEANVVKQKSVAVGVCLFGASWQQLGVPIWLWNGKADFVTRQQQSDGSSTTRVIELSVGSLFTSRRRRGLSYLTDQDQQARSPGDKFCERTSLLSQFEKVWPTF